MNIKKRSQFSFSLFIVIRVRAIQRKTAARSELRNGVTDSVPAWGRSSASSGLANSAGATGSRPRKSKHRALLCRLRLADCHRKENSVAFQERFFMFGSRWLHVSDFKWLLSRFGPDNSTRGRMYHHNETFNCVLDPDTGNWTRHRNLG